MLGSEEKVVRDLFSAVDAQDLGRVAELLSPDFVMMIPGLAEGVKAEGLFQAIKVHYAAFPDWIHEIEDILVEGNRVAVRVAQSGIHKADYEGIPATHKKVTMAAMALVTIENGKIREFWSVEDFLGLYNQLGMELKPKQS